MAKKSVTTEPIRLPNVRLSFARLYTPKAFQPGQDPRYEATFLFDPSKVEHKDVIKKLLKAASDASKEALGMAETPYEIKLLAHQLLGSPLPDPKKQDGVVFAAMYSGDKKPYDGYAGMVALASHNKVRPTVVNRNRNPVVEGDTQAPYSGCYVNATITLWVQNNQYGKRINVNLRGVQFVQDGAAFGIQPVDAEDEFEALEDGDSDVSGSATGEEFDPFK